MYIVFLRFSANRGAAAEHMEGHRAWIGRGFDDGVFLMSGSLAPGLGGVVIAQNEDREALERRVQDDPFVTEDVVTPEIHAVEPGRVNWP